MSSSEDCLAGSLLLVEHTTECQALKIARQVHSFQALVEVFAECQALKTAWQVHSLQVLVEIPAKCQHSIVCGRKSNCTVGAATICVSPCRTNSPSVTGDSYPWMKHHDAYKSVGTEVQESWQPCPQCLALAMFDGAGAVHQGTAG